MARSSLILILLLCLLAGCAATYRAAEDGVAGYRDLQVDATTFYVEYTESSSTEWEQVHRFALKRCAEIAQEQGYDFFDVLSKDEKEVYLKSDVDQITISSMGNIASDPPVTHTYATGARVEGRRVTYKIKLMRE